MDNLTHQVESIKPEIESLIQSTNQIDIYEPIQVQTIETDINSINSKVRIIKLNCESILTSANEPKPFQTGITTVIEDLQKSLINLKTNFDDKKERSESAISHIESNNQKLENVLEKLAISENTEEVQSLVEELIKLQGSSDNLPAQVQISEQIENAMKQARDKKFQLEKQKVEVDTLTWIKSVEDKLDEELTQPMSIVEYNIKQNIHDNIVSETEVRKSEIKSKNGTESPEFKTFVAKVESRTEELNLCKSEIETREELLNIFKKELDNKQKQLQNEFLNIGGLTSSVEQHKEKLELFETEIAEHLAGIDSDGLTQDEKMVVEDKTSQIEKMTENMNNQLADAEKRATEFDEVVFELGDFVCTGFEKMEKAGVEFVKNEKLECVEISVSQQSSKFGEVSKMASNVVILTDLKNDFNKSGKTTKTSVLKNTERCKFGATDTDKISIDKTSENLLNKFYKAEHMVDSALTKAKSDHQRAVDYDMWCSRLRQEISKEISLVQSDEINHCLSKLDSIAGSENDAEIVDLKQQAKARIQEQNEFLLNKKKREDELNVLVGQFEHLTEWVVKAIETIKSEEQIYRSDPDTSNDISDSSEESNDISDERYEIHGDVAMLKEIMRKHKSNNQDIDEKMFKVNEISVTLEEIAVEENSIDPESANSKRIEKIKPKLSSTTENYQELLKLLEDRKMALLMGLQKAETFENETNALLKFLKDSEKKLEGYQFQLDQDQYGMLDEMQKGVQAIKEDFYAKKEDIDDNNFMGSEIISETRFDSSKERIQELLNLIECTYADLNSFIITQENQLANMKKVKSQGKADLGDLINWLHKTNTELEEQVNTQVAELDEDTIGILIDEHEIFQDELFQKQIELTNIRKILPTTENLDNLWNQVWVLAFDRQRILQEAKHRFEAGFNYKEWQKRFVGYLRHKSNTVMFDHFKEFDLHNTGIVTGSDFKKAIVKTSFPTSDANLEHVVGTLDQSKDNKIDYYKFIQSIASNTNVGRGGGSGADEMVLQDKIVSEVGRCTCENRFLLQKAGDRKYKVSQAHFCDKNKLNKQLQV